MSLYQINYSSHESIISEVDTLELCPQCEEELSSDKRCKCIRDQIKVDLSGMNEFIERMKREVIGDK
jgi:hypothetical protein